MNTRASGIKPPCKPPKKVACGGADDAPRKRRPELRQGSKASFRPAANHPALVKSANAARARVSSYSPAQRASLEAEARSVVASKPISIPRPITPRSLAAVLGLRPFQVIYELLGMNLFPALDHHIELRFAQKVGEKHGVVLK